MNVCPEPAGETRFVVRRQRTFGFMIKDVSQRYVSRFEQHARALSLTLADCRTLVLLESNEGLSQSALARLVNLQPMTMVRVVDRMERDGLLQRRSDPDDRRARRLYLTRRARPLLREIARLAELTRNEFFRGVDGARRAAFMRVLERLHANAAALEDAPAIGQPATPRQRRSP
jgi:DNA-binding MarR family transcriptional regulator